MVIYSLDNRHLVYLDASETAFKAGAKMSPWSWHNYPAHCYIFIWHTWTLNIKKKVFVQIMTVPSKSTNTKINSGCKCLIYVLYLVSDTHHTEWGDNFFKHNRRNSDNLTKNWGTFYGQTRLLLTVVFYWKTHRSSI